MDDMLRIYLAVQFAMTIYIGWQLRELTKQQDNDARYFEWWMRSMEERKADKETEQAEDWE